MITSQPVPLQPHLPLQQKTIIMISDPQAPPPSPMDRKDCESPQRTESKPKTDQQRSLHSHGITRDNRAPGLIQAWDDSRETVFIRRIRVDLQIEAMQQIINKQCVIPPKDLKLTQSLPTGEYSGKLKFVQCQGSKSILERLACASKSGKLP